MSLRSGEIVIGVGQRAGGIAALGMGRRAVAARPCGAEPAAAALAYAPAPRHGQTPRAVRFAAPSDRPGHGPADWLGFCVLGEEVVAQARMSR